MQEERSRLFIGSSTEGLPYANAVHAELEATTEPTVWDQNVFLPSRSILEDLERLVHAFDFAVFILTPDDERTTRGLRARVPRDNLIVEVAMFMGAIGRNRVFYVCPADSPLALPSDLLGITTLRYRSRTDGNLRGSVRTACGMVKDRVTELGALRRGAAHDAGNVEELAAAGLSVHTHQDARDLLKRRTARGGVARLDVTATSLEGTLPMIVDVVQKGGLARAAVLHPEASVDAADAARLLANLEFIRQECAGLENQFRVKAHRDVATVPSAIAYDVNDALSLGYIGWYTFHLNIYQEKRMLAAGNPMIVMRSGTDSADSLVRRFAIEEFRRHWDSGESFEVGRSG